MHGQQNIKVWGYVRHLYLITVQEIYIGSDFFKEKMKYNNNNNNDNNDISNKFETPLNSSTEVLDLNHGPEMRYIHFFPLHQAVVNNSGTMSQIRSRQLPSTLFAPWWICILLLSGIWQLVVW